MQRSCRSVADRLAAHSTRAGDCLEWTGAVGLNGYGYLTVGSRPAGTRRARAVHRLAYEQAHGPIPAGAYVLHRCDNRRCMEPAHLYAGDHAQNMADRAERGRTPRGSRVGGSRWTEADVLEATAAVNAGAPLREVAERYGVSRATVSRAARRVTWRHV